MRSIECPSEPLRPDPRRAEHWARLLLGLPSVTGSAEEAELPDRLVEALSNCPAFASERTRIWKIPVPGGPHARACVAVLARGSGRATVILTGHFDTVAVEDYGDLRELALQPEALRDGLLARLRARAALPAERRALADLGGAEFLPGRGLLDMKAGLAAGLALMEAFLAADAPIGNLLFLALPDEEVNSAGARAVAPRLAGLADELGIEIAAAINLDAVADDGDGTAGRSVALGTIGKLSPSALVVGLPTHAGYAFDGLAACALAGAIAAEVEWAPELTDRTGAESGAGPTLLSMKDGKTTCDVTTPATVWMQWNVATHRRSPAEVIEALERLIERALTPLLRRLAEHRRAAGRSEELSRIAITTFAELRREVLERDPGTRAALDAHARSVAQRDLPLAEQCRLITERLWALSGRTQPTIVLGFASLPYLPTTLGDDPPAAILATAAREAASRVAARHATSIGLHRYFLGISDMSFLGQADEADIPVIAANTPAWGFGLMWPTERPFAGIPIVNTGPWGRDYHTPLERLHTPYAFTVLPELLAEIAVGVLHRHE